MSPKRTTWPRYHRADPLSHHPFLGKRTIKKKKKKKTAVTFGRRRRQPGVASGRSALPRWKTSSDGPHQSTVYVCGRTDDPSARSRRTHKTQQRSDKKHLRAKPRQTNCHVCKISSDGRHQNLHTWAKKRPVAKTAETDTLNKKKRSGSV